jgi:adenosylcobinamide kinase/adenosylcobinamide-phosphate guanylyltransferase
MKFIFVTGGCRSGKSDFTQKYAESLEGKRTYIATALPIDSEMEERIKKHQEKRKKKWHFLIEEPFDLKNTVIRLNGKTDIGLIDCITVWINNLLYKFDNSYEKTTEEINLFIENLKKVEYNILIVSNEVGAGIVPMNKLARMFRDISGETNRKLAKISDEFYTCFSGYPLRLK